MLLDYHQIVAEERGVESRTSDLLQEWEKEKPISGALRPDAALKNLTIFEGKFARLKEERDNVSKAKEALELQDSGAYSASDERVAVGIEELQVRRRFFCSLLLRAAWTYVQLAFVVWYAEE